jgi:hypothetical protein
MEQNNVFIQVVEIMCYFSQPSSSRAVIFSTDYTIDTHLIKTSETFIAIYHPSLSTNMLDRQHAVSCECLVLKLELSGSSEDGTSNHCYTCDSITYPSMVTTDQHYIFLVSVFVGFSVAV